jgi:ABC transporter substrate binding protein (PQQ-dependent alcohol dehydrogenase system)
VKCITLLLLALAAWPAEASTFRLSLLVPADDPRLERSRLDRAVVGQPGGSAADGLKVALAESRFELEAAGHKFELEVLEVGDIAAAKAAVLKAERGGVAAIVADLPSPWLLAAADAAKLPLLNVGAAADGLSQSDCRRNLWHVLPSERMRSDALAQFLAARRWQQVLLLTGPSDADRERAETAQASIRRYGLKLVASRPFKVSADPRERELANPLLLTQGSYDVTWVVDSDGEFAVGLPYRGALPRPVVGDAGLVAVAWSPRFERFGAPQVSRRFAKAASRPMGAHDWAAWMAGKLLVAAAVAPGVQGPAALAQALSTAQVDGSKGVSLSLRPWDGQLRQPMLLSDGIAVIATSPQDGVLHPKDALDTLGADAPEKLCKARP